MHPLVRYAQVIAQLAHAGQTRFDGTTPYITHPAQVAAAFPDDPVRAAIGWLHDVVEDTQVTLADLSAIGIPADVLRGVATMTRRSGETYWTYVARALADPLAGPVKLADIKANKGTLPAGHSLHARYARSLEIARELGTEPTLAAPVPKKRPQPDLTQLQRAALYRAIQAHPEWIRAVDSGDRVTLASLYYRGWFERQVRRGTAGAANAAYEYRPTAQIMTTWQEAHPKRGV